MFISSIEITSYLSYIKEIVRRYQQLNTKTRDILLIQHVDIEEQLNLITPFITLILKLDKEVNKNSTKAKRKVVASNTADLPRMQPAPLRENISSSFRVLIFS